MTTTNNNGTFYGWYIIAATAVGICFGYVGTMIYAFSTFVLPLEEELGWSRGAISFGLTLSNWSMLLSAPLVGLLADKKGVRAALLPSTLCFGVLLCSFYFLTGNLWHFYASMIALTVLGSGTASIAYVRLLVTWFDKRKGLALALGTSGAGVAAIVLPPAVSYVISTAGWREAYLALGGINLVLVLPLIYFVIRNSPADVNSFPDGIANTGAAAPADVNQIGRSFEQCLRTGAFWKLAIATMLLGAMLNGTTSQMVPLLVDKGLDRAEAAGLASLLGVSIIIARLVSGYLLDRFHAPFVAGLFLLCPAIGFTCLAIAPSHITAAITVISVGIGLGMEFDALGYLCTQYFGRRALGRIYGLLFVVFNIGGGVGVFFAGHSYDAFTSYTPALFVGASLSVLAVLFIASLGKYPKLAAAG
ncbi:MAG: MFS transporter [Nevskiaceae bacterium]|jgi:predicted MFS family arabinose efflux permease|nr:MFS transporter [Nevskiaceae bacterium]